MRILPVTSLFLIINLTNAQIFQGYQLGETQNREKRHNNIYEFLRHLLASESPQNNYQQYSSQQSYPSPFYHNLGNERVIVNVNQPDSNPTTIINNLHPEYSNSCPCEKYVRGANNELECLCPMKQIYAKCPKNNVCVLKSYCDHGLLFDTTVLQRGLVSQLNLCDESTHVCCLPPVAVQKENSFGEVYNHFINTTIDHLNNTVTKYVITGNVYLNNGNPTSTTQFKLKNKENVQHPITENQRGSIPQFQQENAPQFQQGSAPQFQQGSAPQFQQDTAPQIRQGNTPQFQQETAPQFQQENTPQFQQGNTPQFQQGTAPQFQQGNAPQFQQENAPQFQQPNQVQPNIYQSTQNQPGSIQSNQNQPTQYEPVQFMPNPFKQDPSVALSAAPQPENVIPVEMTTEAPQDERNIVQLAIPSTTERNNKFHTSPPNLVRPTTPRIEIDSKVKEDPTEDNLVTAHNDLLSQNEIEMIFGKLPDSTTFPGLAKEPSVVGGLNLQPNEESSVGVSLIENAPATSLSQMDFPQFGLQAPMRKPEIFLTGKIEKLRNTSVSNTTNTQKLAQGIGQRINVELLANTFPTRAPAFNQVQEELFKFEGTTIMPVNLIAEYMFPNSMPSNFRAPSSANPVLMSCPAEMKCVQNMYCTPDGYISTVPVILTKEEEVIKDRLLNCGDEAAGRVGKCCLDRHT